MYCFFIHCVQELLFCSIKQKFCFILTISPPESKSYTMWFINMAWFTCFFLQSFPGKIFYSHVNKFIKIRNWDVVWKTEVVPSSSNSGLSLLLMVTRYRYFQHYLVIYLLNLLWNQRHKDILPCHVVVLDCLPDIQPWIPINQNTLLLLYEWSFKVIVK